MSEYDVVVLGAYNVGKTSFTNRFVSNDFDDEECEDASAGEDNLIRKTLHINNEYVQLNILDTNETDNETSMRMFYMENAKGFIIVYAIDDRSSFEEVESFYKDITHAKGTKKVPIVICGNKYDHHNDDMIDYGLAPNNYELNGKLNKLIIGLKSELVAQIRGQIVPDSSSKFKKAIKSIVSQVIDSMEDVFSTYGPEIDYELKSDIINILAKEIAEELNHCTNNRVVSTAEGELLAERLNTDFFETSAKTGLNVRKTFEALDRKIRSHASMQRRESDESSSTCEIF